VYGGDSKLLIYPTIKASIPPLVIFAQQMRVALLPSTSQETNPNPSEIYPTGGLKRITRGASRQSPRRSISKNRGFLLSGPADKKRSRSEPPLGTPNSDPQRRSRREPPLCTIAKRIGLNGSARGQCRKRRPSPRAPVKGMRTFYRESAPSGGESGGAGRKRWRSSSAAAKGMRVCTESRPLPGANQLGWFGGELKTKHPPCWGGCVIYQTF
jgi:hypothetical protein